MKVFNIFFFFNLEFDYGIFIYKFFFLSYEMFMWFEVEIYCCDVEGGYFVSVWDLWESKYIELKLWMFRYYFGYFKWWIGVLDFYSEGNFSWIDGKFFKY